MRIAMKLVSATETTPSFVSTRTVLAFVSRAPLAKNAKRLVLLDFTAKNALKNVNARTEQIAIQFPVNASASQDIKDQFVDNLALITLTVPTAQRLANA